MISNPSDKKLPMTQEETLAQLSSQLTSDIAAVTKAIEDFESSLVRLPPLAFGDTPECLTLTIDQLRKKTPEQLLEYSFSVAQYSLYVQRCINREQGWLTWLISKLDEAASNEIDKIGNEFGWNERMLMAKHRPVICQVIQRAIRKTQIRLDQIKYLPKEIGRIADLMRDLYFMALRKDKVHASTTEDR